jgi:hypothetical protein
MKALSVSLALGVALLVGCGRKDETQPAKSTNDTVATGNPLTAPVDYLGAVAAAKKSSVKTIDTVYLNQAIQLFHTSEGRYPKDLNELAAEGFITRIPDAPYGMKIVYNATKGEVKVVQQQTNAAPVRR